MRILVTGKDGQVGRSLAGQQWGEAELVFLGRNDCDMSRPDEIRARVRSIVPGVIVNAAAYTAVDKAEADRDACFAVNATAAGILAGEAARLNALLIHYSTDYVFNGEKEQPYVETDPIAPLGVYGASKAAGEAAIAAAAPRYLILRTSWVYAPQGKNFLLTMLRLAAEREELRVVDDQIGAPTSAPAIARATSRLIERYLRRKAFASGVYHMTAGGATSWCGFARAIFREAPIGRKPRVVPISTVDYPTPARRPKNSVLSNAKFEREFGFRLGGWEQEMKDVLTSMPDFGERAAVGSASGDQKGA